jgi:hypothetical protein
MPHGHPPLQFPADSVGNSFRPPLSVRDLPKNVQTTVPTCAQSCLSTYIDQLYSCAEGDASCLCGKYSSQGYTLGEIALLCLHLECPQATGDQERAAYSICSAQATAASATHRVLTLPSTPVPTATSSRSSHQTPQPTLSSSTTITVFPSVTAVSTSQPSATSSETPKSTGGPSAVGSGKSSTGLTKPQAVGVSIGAAAAVLIAVGLVYFCLWRRRKARRHESRNSYDFIDDAPRGPSPFYHSFATLPNHPHGLDNSTTTYVSEKHHTAWPSQFHQPQQYAYETTASHNPHFGGLAGGRQSTRSMRTLSQLLPDRPGSRLVPLQSHLDIVRTPATVFEEEESPRLPPLPMHGLPSHPAIAKMRPPPASKKYLAPYEPAKHVPLSIVIPRERPWPGPSGILEHGASLDPHRLQVQQTQECASATSQAVSSSTSVLDYYASADSGTVEDLYSSTPVDEATQVRPPPPAAITLTKPICPPRAVRASGASDCSRRTSFESNDPDAVTPPDEEDQRLTPVAESPISNLRYPKIPRSSNQAIPRPLSYKNPGPRGAVQGATPCANHEAGMVPKAATPDLSFTRGHTPTLSGSTLAAKRRGDHIASELEQGLYIKHSAHTSRSNSQEGDRSPDGKDATQKRRQRHESPLRGYGRMKSNGQPASTKPLTIEMKSPGSLKSPLWEPKLTPSRKGEDLYLQVSVATPQDAHFRGWQQRY